MQMLEDGSSSRHRRRRQSRISKSMESPPALQKKHRRSQKAPTESMDTGLSCSASYGTRKSHDRSCGNVGPVGEAPAPGKYRGTTRRRTTHGDNQFLCQRHAAGDDGIIQSSASPCINDLHARNNSNHVAGSNTTKTLIGTPMKRPKVSPLHGQSHVFHRVGMSGEAPTGETDGNFLHFFSAVHLKSPDRLHGSAAALDGGYRHKPPSSPSFSEFRQSVSIHALDLLLRHCLYFRSSGVTYIR